MAYRYLFACGQPDADYAAFGMQTGETVGMVGGTIFTFLWARRLMHRLEGKFVAHGVVVAIAAIAFSVAGSIVGHQGVPTRYIIASALKLGAGALAGLLYSRTISGNRNEV